MSVLKKKQSMLFVVPSGKISKRTKERMKFYRKIGYRVKARRMGAFKFKNGSEIKFREGVWHDEASRFTGSQYEEMIHD